ncbi:MAG TPA: hypothetical protein VI461_03905 [Chitinophagaceae bacterium]|nr:hypothetical protein [Chitinophagaceae bacterium]
MSTASTSAGGNQPVRNIIVGVITTVLGSTAVYFLGFHNKNERSTAESMLITKEVTIKAWNDYVATENMFTKNWSTLGANYSTARFKIYKEESLEELTKFFNDLTRIIQTKDADPALVSLLKRRMSAKQRWEKKYRIHLDNFESILNNTPQQEQDQKLREEIGNFQSEVKDLDPRFKNELEDAAKTLSSNYHYSFSSSDILAFKKEELKDNGSTTNTGTGAVGQPAVDKQSLTGTWLIDQSWSIYHYADGRLYMYFTTNGVKDSTYGTWQLTNNQLYHYANYYFNAGNQWVYDISDVTTASFTLKLTTSPYTQYFVRRINY